MHCSRRKIWRCCEQPRNKQPAHLCSVVHGPCCQDGGVGVEGQAHDLHFVACTQPTRAACAHVRRVSASRPCLVAAAVVHSSKHGARLGNHQEPAHMHRTQQEHSSYASVPCLPLSCWQHCPLFTSHSLAVLSKLPVATRSPYGVLKAIAYTWGTNKASFAGSVPTMRAVL